MQHVTEQQIKLVQAKTRSHIAEICGWTNLSISEEYEVFGFPPQEQEIHEFTPWMESIYWKGHEIGRKAGDDEVQFTEVQSEIG